MGLVNSALNIGRSAVTSYQSALSVVGNNIANAANPDYTRQRAVLQPVLGATLPQGVRPGGGWRDPLECRSLRNSDRA